MNFIKNLAQYGQKIALIDDNNQTMTYAAMFDDMKKIINFLNQTQKKTLIFLLVSNNIPSIIGYLSALESNHVAILLEPTITPVFLNQLINKYRPEFIFQPLVDNENEILLNYRTYGLYKTGYENTEDIYSELALLLSTSGSTGSPKQVRLTLSNLQSNAESIIEYLKIDHTEKAITTLPMNYSYGLSVINTHLLVGATLLLTNYSVMTKEFWSFFSKYEATSLAGVPYTYEMFRRINPFKHQIGSLRYMTQAGGKLKSNLVSYFAEECQKNNVKFYVMYGQTEATARMSYLDSQEVLSHPSSIGKAIPGGKFELIDENNLIIFEANVQGELWYFGPNVMLGYAESREDLAKNDVLQGKLKTGDLAYFDKEGYMYISGRLQRFIKIAGRRISLDELEKYFFEQGFEIYCGGEDECLKLAVMDEKVISDLKKILSEVYQIHHSMTRLYLIREIPKNSAGKILYKEIFELGLHL